MCRAGAVGVFGGGNTGVCCESAERWRFRMSGEEKEGAESFLLVPSALSNAQTSGVSRVCFPCHRRPAMGRSVPARLGRSRLTPPPPALWGQLAARHTKQSGGGVLEKPTRVRSQFPFFFLKQQRIGGNALVRKVTLLTTLEARDSTDRRDFR